MGKLILKILGWKNKSRTPSEILKYIFFNFVWFIDFSGYVFICEVRNKTNNLKKISDEKIKSEIVKIIFLIKHKVMRK